MVATQESIEITLKTNNLRTLSYWANIVISVVTIAILVYAFVSTVFFGPASTNILPGLVITIALMVWTTSAYLFLIWQHQKETLLLRRKFTTISSLVVVGLSAIVLLVAFSFRLNPQSALVLVFLPVLQWVGCAILLLIDSVITHKESKDKLRTRWTVLKPKLILFLLAVAILFAGWWFLQSPSNERDWVPNLAKLPRTTFDGENVTIQNIRNTQYRSAKDYTPKYESRTYDLRKINSIEFVVVPFSSVKIAAHTFLVFVF